MLELRPNCEPCDRDLPPESSEAMIGSTQCVRRRLAAATHDALLARDRSIPATLP